MAVHGRWFARFAVVDAEDAASAGALQAAAGEAASALSGVRGVAHAKAWLGFPFREDPSVGETDLRLAAVSAVGSDRGALADVWPAATAALEPAARFDVELELVRSGGDGWGIAPDLDAVRPLGPDEPVLVVISGDLHPEHVAAFQTAGGPAVAQANADPAYLGGVGLTSNGLDITSFSCWTSTRAARRYAFGAGAHREAKDADETLGWHDRATAFFGTFRVLEASGTLLGAAPFAVSS
jgi:hypothetical protein